MSILTTQVDELFTEWNRPDSPGCAIGIIRDGRMVYSRGYGMADLAKGSPITSTSVFHVASMSKQFTAACLALFVLDGAVSLDDDVRKYVRGLPDYGDAITVRHLAYHTGGLRDDYDLHILAGGSNEDHLDNQAALTLLARQKALNFKPGEQQLYSNSGYLLMAEIVRVVSGTSLGDFAQKSIFGPLGMGDTFFDDGSRSVQDTVISYEAEKQGRFRLYEKNMKHVGHSGLMTTIDDLYLWDQNFYADKLGDGRVMKELLTHGTLVTGREVNYAFGLHHGEYKGLKTVASPGMVQGFRCQMLRFPEQNFTVICLGNVSTVDRYKLPRQVADVYLAGGFTFGELAGNYYSDELNTTYTLAPRAGELYFTHKNAPDGPLVPDPYEPMRRDRYLCDELAGFTLEIDFHRDTQDQVTGFTLDHGRAKKLQFVRT